jgi:hypothetical protein
MNHQRFIEAADIVFCNFPMHDGSKLYHPGLVIAVEQVATGRTWLRLALGSSKHVCESGHLNTEFVIVTAEDIQRAGLHKATVFDLSKTARVSVTDCRLMGCVDMKDAKTFARLRAAVLASMV